MGISYKAGITNSKTVKTVILTNSKKVISDATLLMSAEKNFIDAFRIHKSAAIKKVLTKDSWFSINGYPPLKNAEAINSVIDILSSDIVFTLWDNLNKKTESQK